MPTVRITRKRSTKVSADAERSGTSPLSPPERAATHVIAGTFLGLTHSFIQRAPTLVSWPMSSEISPWTTARICAGGAGEDAF